MTPVAVVTGATGGLGYAVAEGLARAGYRTVLTGRNAAKGEAALTRLRAAVPQADAAYDHLDVASLAVVADFAARWEGKLDLLVNNAGVMAYPTRRVTADGFEAQLGTNYLGHFALTLRLLPALREAGAARVVSVSSLAHRNARIDFDDLQAERRYSPTGSYRQSKLAILMFARELQRRAAAQGWPVVSIAAHPGWSATDIVENGMGSGPVAQLARGAFRAMAQSAAQGARPILFAALDPAAAPGGYYGPAYFVETRGPPVPSKLSPAARDAAAAARLWQLSERLTGVAMPPA